MSLTPEREEPGIRVGRDGRCAERELVWGMDIGWWHCMPFIAIELMKYSSPTAEYRLTRRHKW
jgi:hypothetical protein